MVRKKATATETNGTSAIVENPTDLTPIFDAEDGKHTTEPLNPKRPPTLEVLPEEILEIIRFAAEGSNLEESKVVSLVLMDALTGDGKLIALYRQIAAQTKAQHYQAEKTLLQSQLAQLEAEAQMYGLPLV